MEITDRRLRTVAHCAAAALLMLATVRCGSSVTTPSTFTLSGVITDAATASPIASAHVDLLNGSTLLESTTADGAGKYTLTNIASGTDTVRASANGYVTQSMPITVSASATVNVGLSAATSTASATLVDALDASAVSGVTATGQSLSGGPSDASGNLNLVVAGSSAAPRSIVLDGSAVYERRTAMRVPGPAAVISLITTGIDMTGFDQMFRGGQGLKRWTSAPQLILETRTLQYVNTNSVFSATALSENMTDDEVSTWLADLAWGLPQMTGGTFQAFASITVRTTPPGQVANQSNVGFITVAREQGMNAATGTTLGLGTWLQNPDFSVAGGILTLDRDEDMTTGPVRRIIRTHELGHSLGYSHVTSQLSVMSPNCCAIDTLTAFDLAVTKIAFQRPPGSTTPDTDPAGNSVNVQGGAPSWVPPIR